MEGQLIAFLNQVCISHFKFNSWRNDEKAKEGEKDEVTT